MKLFLHSSLMIFFFVNFGTAENLNHMNELEKHITDLKPYQITLFKNNTTCVKRNFVFKTLISKLSTVLIGSENNLSLNQLLIAPSIILKRKSNLLLMFQDQFDPNEVQSILERYIQLSSLKIRPKCLVIFSDFSPTYDSIKSTLLYGWSKKFLDLTILNIKNSEIFSYNPFFNYFKHNRAMSVDIFPNKLKNMNKYPVRIPFLPYPPYQIKLKVENATEYCGSDIDLIKFFGPALNFKLDLVEINPSLHSLITLTKSSEMDMMSGHYSLLFNLHDVFEVGITVSFNEICAVIAYDNLFEMELSIIKLIFLASNIIFILSIASFEDFKN